MLTEVLDGFPPRWTQSLNLQVGPPRFGRYEWNWQRNNSFGAEEAQCGVLGSCAYCRVELLAGLFRSAEPTTEEQQFRYYAEELGLPSQLSRGRTIPLFKESPGGGKAVVCWAKLVISPLQAEELSFDIYVLEISEDTHINNKSFLHNTSLGFPSPRCHAFPTERIAIWHAFIPSTPWILCTPKSGTTWMMGT